MALFVKEVPKFGTIRSKRKFIWWPKKLRKFMSTTCFIKWLGFETIVQQFSEWGWKDVCWGDDHDEKR